MNVWKLNTWKKIYKTANVRCGLRLRCEKNVDPEVKRACKEFCKWLRKEYKFPIRVVIYLKEKCTVKAMDGEEVSAIFFRPDDKYVEPYIKVSTGDYIESVNECGKDNTLAGYLHSIAHELTHYYQWINDLELTLIGEERQAYRYADKILEDYAETREHP